MSYQLTAHSLEYVSFGPGKSPPSGKTYLYIIGEHDSDLMPCQQIKIGIARNPASRVRDLQPGHHSRLVVHRAYPYETRSAALAAERHFHKFFEDVRMCGEWFGITLQEAIEGIEAGGK